MNDPEREFFLTGAKSYLDVSDAMSEFRRQVQQQCTEVITARLQDINQASQMDWTADDLKDYQWTEGHDIGKQLPVDGFGGLYFCLELYREASGVCYGALIYLWRRRANLAPTLWAILEEHPSDTRWCDGNSLIFWQELAEDQLTDFQTYLNKAVDEFLAFVEAVGGLKKYASEP
jgi:hypothetical protein